VCASASPCQDDNLRDVARAYARRGVQLLVVPTLEGPPAVAPCHFRNSVLRTIENPMALVRATADGQGAAIAPGRKIVASFDHARDMPEPRPRGSRLHHRPGRRKAHPADGATGALRTNPITLAARTHQESRQLTLRRNSIDRAHSSRPTTMVS